MSSIAKLVVGAKRPVLLIGSQATLPPVIPEELVKAVQVGGIIKLLPLRPFPFSSILSSNETRMTT